MNTWPAPLGLKVVATTLRCPGDLFSGQSHSRPIKEGGNEARGQLHTVHIESRVNVIGHDPPKVHGYLGMFWQNEGSRSNTLRGQLQRKTNYP